jgi:hypothetical protein
VFTNLVDIMELLSMPSMELCAGSRRLPGVVGKSIITNPGYFSSSRFLNGEGVKHLLFSKLESLVKG